MKVSQPQIQAVHASYWNEEKRAADRPPVLLVDGDADKLVVEGIFHQHSRRPRETHTRVVVAGAPPFDTLLALLLP